MNATRDIAIWLCSKKGKKKKKKNHRGHARLFARWGSRIIRVWSVWYKVVKTGWRRKGSSSRSHWLGILIKNNQYCNINKCPSLLYQLPVPTSTAAAFSSFLPSKSIRPARHIVELQKTFLNAPRHPPTQHLPMRHESRICLPIVLSVLRCVNWWREWRRNEIVRRIQISNCFISILVLRETSISIPIFREKKIMSSK